MGQLFIKDGHVVTKSDGSLCFDDACICDLCRIDYTQYDRYLYVGSVPQDILNQYPFENDLKFPTIKDAIDSIGTNVVTSLVGYSEKHGYKEGATYADIDEFKDNILLVQQDTAYFITSESRYYTRVRDIILDYNISTQLDMIGQAYISNDRIYIQDENKVRILNYNLSNIYDTKSNLEQDYNNQTIGEYYGYFDSNVLYAEQFTALNNDTPEYVDIEDSYTDDYSDVYYGINWCKHFIISVGDGIYNDDIPPLSYGYSALIEAQNKFGVTIGGNVDDGSSDYAFRMQIIDVKIIGDTIKTLRADFCNCELGVNYDLESDINTNIEAEYTRFRYCFGFIKQTDKINNTTQGAFKSIEVNGIDCYDLSISGYSVADGVEKMPPKIIGEITGNNLTITSGDAGSILNTQYLKGYNGGAIELQISGTGTIRSGNGGKVVCGSDDGLVYDSGSAGEMKITFTDEYVNDFDVIVGKGGDGGDATITSSGRVANAGNCSWDAIYNSFYFEGKGNYNIVKSGLGVGGSPLATSALVYDNNYATYAGNNEIGAGYSLYINDSEAYVSMDFSCTMQNGKDGGFVLPEDVDRRACKNGKGGNAGAYSKKIEVNIDGHEEYKNNITFNFGTPANGGNGLDGANGLSEADNSLEYRCDGISGGDSGNGGYTTIIEYRYAIPYEYVSPICGDSGTPGNGGDGVCVYDHESSDSYPQNIGYCGNGGNAGLSLNAVNGGNGGDATGELVFYRGVSSDDTPVAGSGGNGSFGIIDGFCITNSHGGNGGTTGVINTLYGNGGRGGDGGDAMFGGSGANGGLGLTHIEHVDDPNDLHKGGSGGDGGHGGDGLISSGNGGDGADDDEPNVQGAGNGGNGGIIQGYDCDTSIYTNGFTLTSGNGGNGGDADYEFKYTYSGTDYWYYGYGGSGGDGGNVDGPGALPSGIQGTAYTGDGGDGGKGSSAKNGDNDGAPGNAGSCNTISSITCIEGSDGV